MSAHSLSDPWQLQLPLSVYQPRTSLADVQCLLRNLALADSQQDLPISTKRLLGDDRDEAIGVYKILFRIAGRCGLGVSD